MLTDLHNSAPLRQLPGSTARKWNMVETGRQPVEHKLKSERCMLEVCRWGKRKTCAALCTGAVTLLPDYFCHCGNMKISKGCRHELIQECKRHRQSAATALIQDSRHYKIRTSPTPLSLSCTVIAAALPRAAHGAATTVFTAAANTLVTAARRKAGKAGCGPWRTWPAQPPRTQWCSRWCRQT